MLSLVLPALAIRSADPTFEFDLRPSAGLTIRVADVDWVVGDSIQFFAPGWTKGYFSTHNGPQTVTHPDADTAVLTFQGGDGRASGKETAHRDGDRLTVHYHLEWSDPVSAEVELTTGLLSAPVLQAGTLVAAERPTRNLMSANYSPDQDLGQRRFSPDAQDYAFNAPVGQLAVRSSIPMTLFDARGYRQDYAEGRSLWWYGALDLPVTKSRPLDVEVAWTIHPNPLAPPRALTRSVSARSVSDARVPDSGPVPLIPKPRRATLDYDHPVTLTNLFAFPAGRPRFWGLFKDILSRRFEVPAPAHGASAINVDGGVSRMQLIPGGYTIHIRPGAISVLGEEDEGLRNGMYRLAQLAFVRGGRLLLPSGQIEDQPRIAWRGVHLFGGPDARDFQRRLWDRVLLPLGLNKVVVECERTAWQTTPLAPSIHPMSREALAGLFDDYRKIGVEPIPLIQSLGHMGWFFEGGRRLDLAVNPLIPYTLDPRKLATKTATEALWDEAIDLLHPSTVHFGCDEIDLLGMTPSNPELTTDLWRAQMATLGGIAHRRGVQMMIWGDEALAPGEAIDATDGDSPQAAADRRAAIPAGTVICDWHYAAQSDPAKFYPTLQFWRREGFTPIAATWYRPENIAGFDRAATMEHDGALQTTWAGYDSDERAMIDHPEQFTALVLAADYAWSGRSETPDRLDYDPATVFRRLFYGDPAPVTPDPGYSLNEADRFPSLTIGNTTFRPFAPIAFRSISVPGRADAPSEATLTCANPPTVRRVSFALEVAEPLPTGRVVGTVKLTLVGGATVIRNLVYGHHVRAVSDHRLTPYAERGESGCAVTFDLPRPAAVSRIAVSVTDRTAGLVWRGVTEF